jgi:hypothetical protein
MLTCDQSRPVDHDSADYAKRFRALKTHRSAIVAYCSGQVFNRRVITAI